MAHTGPSLHRVRGHQDYPWQGLVWLEGSELLESDCFLQHVSASETQTSYLVRIFVNLIYELHFIRLFLYTFYWLWIVIILWKPTFK